MGIVLESEQFFLRKIKEGLGYKGLKDLSVDEERILLTHFTVLDTTPDKDGSFKEFARELQARAIGALTESYARDTAGKNRDRAAMWRRQLEQIDQCSECVIAGIVTQWYKSVGRAQEKSATGCLVLVLIPALGLIASALAHA